MLPSDEISPYEVRQANLPVGLVSGKAVDTPLVDAGARPDEKAAGRSCYHQSKWHQPC